jgi:hypothetical protein
MNLIKSLPQFSQCEDQEPATWQLHSWGIPQSG